MDLLNVRLGAIEGRGRQAMEPARQRTGSLSDTVVLAPGRPTFDAIAALADHSLQPGWTTGMDKDACWLDAKRSHGSSSAACQRLTGAMLRAFERQEGRLAGCWRRH